jgi:hypothetical protein
MSFAFFDSSLETQLHALVDFEHYNCLRMEDMSPVVAFITNEQLEEGSRIR